LKLIWSRGLVNDAPQFLQRKNEWRAGNLTATHVAKTLNFFFKHEKYVEPIQKKIYRRQLNRKGARTQRTQQLI
jgi:hypothetical protein